MNRILVCLGGLALLTTGAVAGNENGQPTVKTGVIVLHHGQNDILVEGGREFLAGPVPAPIASEVNNPSLVTIFSNLASKYPKGLYWCCGGWTVNGPTAISGYPQYSTAAAFTPDADHTLTKIEVAAAWVEGTNGLVLSLRADAGGVPGKTLKTWNVSNLPNGTCCALVVKSDKSGIPVSGGQQYWVVLSTNSSESDTFATWDFADSDEIDPSTMALYCSDDQGGDCGGGNDQWSSFPSAPPLAFAVMGSN